MSTLRQWPYLQPHEIQCSCHIFVHDFDLNFRQTIQRFTLEYHKNKCRLRMFKPHEGPMWLGQNKQVNIPIRFKLRIESSQVATAEDKQDSILARLPKMTRTSVRQTIALCLPIYFLTAFFIQHFLPSVLFHMHSLCFTPFPISHPVCYTSY